MTRSVEHARSIVPTLERETSMSTSNLSAAANETLQSCGQTAEALIGACRSGGNRVIGRVDAGWDGWSHAAARV